MKIKTFRKLKNGQYQLQLEDERELMVYEDLILKYDLLLHKQLTEETMKQIAKDNKKQEGYYTALKFLKKQMKSKREIRDYLLKREYDTAVIEYAVKRLTDQGYLNDKNYASSFVQHQLLLTNNGPIKIKYELQKKGIDDILIDDALKDYTEEEMQDKIIKLIDKLTKSNHNKSNQVLSRKIIDQLSNQGFPKYLITSQLAKTTLKDDREIAKREYEKLYQRLKRKYSGKELEYRIKQKMYQKGFSYETE